MARRDLLLEIGCEEIPARFMPGALKELKENAKEHLKEHYLEFTEVFTFGTPRRLVLLVKALAEEQLPREEKIKGPSREASFDREGRPTKAAGGFAAKYGLKIEELTIEKLNGREYLVAVRKISGEKTSKLLPPLLYELVKSIHFPKNMYWEESRARFPRPIRWLLCLYGEEVIPFTYAGLTAGRQTRGHRFLSPGPLAVRDPRHYFEALEEASVVVDQYKRKDMIAEKIRSAAFSRQLEPRLNPALLEEVLFLVESPEALLCSFPQEFLHLPQEVLVTTMQSHQRYFPLEEQQGGLSSFFVAISNNPAAPKDNVRSGYERVLKARLADARFFYREDLKSPLEEKVDKLKAILFLEGLGTLYDKTLRLVSLCEFLAEQIGADEQEKEAALRAAYLCKADLATNIVGEFPELQGIMGREYALKSNEKEAVARAIFEHYLPRFAGDTLPQTRPGAIVALADKIDHLAGCFALGLKPSGSQDPYALRRSCLGLLQILLEHKFLLPLDLLIEKALELYRRRENLRELPFRELAEEIREFARQRLRFILQEKGIDYDIIEAALNCSLQEVGPVVQRAQFLQENKNSAELALAATAYIRTANLARQASREIEFKEELLKEEGEKRLFQSFMEKEAKFLAALKEDNLMGALSALAGLKGPLDQFFDAVLVMAPEDALRFNRLALLLKIKEMFLMLADFSKIVFTPRP